MGIGFASLHRVKYWQVIQVISAGCIASLRDQFSFLLIKQTCTKREKEREREREREKIKEREKEKEDHHRLTHGLGLKKHI
jgi:hypothetical protein